MYKVIVFDLDDTLYFEKDYIKSGYKVVAKHLSQKYRLDENLIYKEMLILFRKNPKYVFNRILEKHGISYLDEDIKNMVIIYRNHKPTIELSKVVKKTLSSLLKKGYYLGLITDGFKESQKQKIEALKLNTYFQKIIITDDLGENREYWKPHEKSYELIRDYFGVEYKEMVYVGDNVLKDFIAPIKLGILPIQIMNRKNLYKVKNKKIIKIKGINKILKKI